MDTKDAIVYALADGAYSAEIGHLSGQIGHPVTMG